MTTAHHPRNVEDRLWKEIRSQRFGMLGLVNSHDHYQPMTAFAEPDNSLIWFFTRETTDLAKAVGDGAKAMFIVQTKDQDVQACIGGELVLDHDRGRIDEYWNPMVAAWYPEGKDAPDLTLLRFKPNDAAVWLSDGSPIKFAFEIAKANLTKTTPDVGSREAVKFD
jgi:general stress protein 26